MLLLRSNAIYTRRLCMFWRHKHASAMDDTSRARIFLVHFLPALKNVYKKSGARCSVLKTKQNIRLAADVCLAQTANEITGSGWSRALNLRLHRKITKQALSSVRSRCKPVKNPRASRNLLRRLRATALKPKNVAVERRVRALQRLVPGGSDMNNIDILFQETADYIVNLQMQVYTMQALADFCSSEYPDRSCGGGEFHKCSVLQVVSRV